MCIINSNKLYGCENSIMEAKVILNRDLANYLLTLGYDIIKLKANKHGTGSVFVFRNEKGLSEEAWKWLSENSIV